MLKLKVPTRLAMVSCIAVAILVGAPAPAVGAEEMSRGDWATRDEIQSMIDDSRTLLRISPNRESLLRDLDRAERLLRDSPNDEFNRASAHFGAELRHFADLIHQLAGSLEPPGSVEDDRNMASVGFPYAFYPHLPWEFVISGNTNTPPPTGDETASGSGVCTKDTALDAEGKVFALNILLAAEGAREVFSRICTTTIEPLCIVTDILYIAAHGTVDNMFLCYDLMTEAEVKGTYLRLEHLHDDLVSMESSIASRLDLLETNVIANIDINEGLILDIDSDLVNHDTNMENRTNQIAARIAALTQFLEEFRAEDMRMEIESSLADADNKAVGTFQLPSTLGGQLELVHSIVVETIALLEAAGQDVGNAHNTLRQAESYLAAGDWGRAYRSFGNAYRAAAR